METINQINKKEQKVIVKLMVIFCSLFMFITFGYGQEGYYKMEKYKSESGLQSIVLSSYLTDNPSEEIEANYIINGVHHFYENSKKCSKCNPSGSVYFLILRDTKLKIRALTHFTRAVNINKLKIKDKDSIVIKFYLKEETLVHFN